MANRELHAILTELRRELARVLGDELEGVILAEGLSFSSHAAVIAAFGKTFAKSERLDSRFHRYLIDAQDVRNQGDYGMGTEVRRSWTTCWPGLMNSWRRPPPFSKHTPARHRMWIRIDQQANGGRLCQLR